MRFASAPGLDVIAPGLLQQDWREAEIFGAATWLWMHASTRRETPLKWLSTLLLPPIVHRQFLLATEGDRPASIIVNEVNSSHPSLLHGYADVAGQRATHKLRPVATATQLVAWA